MLNSESSAYKGDVKIAKEDKKAKKRKKKKQKHKHKRPSDHKSTTEINFHSRPEVNDTDETPHKCGKSSNITDSSDDNENNLSKRHKREKKTKKTKKKKKKRNHIPDTSCDEDANNPKRVNMDHSIDKNMKGGIRSTRKESDEKVVSSSAIEFYPEKVKYLQLQRNEKNAMLVQKNDVELKKQGA